MRFYLPELGGVIFVLAVSVAGTKQPPFTQPDYAAPTSRMAGNLPIQLRTHAAIGVERFVSPEGSDTNDGTTLATAWKTVAHARDALRPVLARGLRTDVDVWLMQGTYTLTEPLVFAEADGAGSGPESAETYSIRYRSHPSNSGPVVFSDFVEVPGPWSMLPQSAGYAFATFVASWRGRPSRQVLINGSLAKEVVSDGLDPRYWANRTEQGYELKDGLLQEYYEQQPAGPDGKRDPIELLYSGVGSTWSEARCRIAEVRSGSTLFGPNGTTVIMDQPCWAKGRARGKGSQAITHPSTISSAAAGPVMHNCVGCAFVSTSSGQVVVRDGNMVRFANSTRVAVPTLPYIMSVNGATGITFEGITFEGSSWLGPDTGEGFVDRQGGELYVGVPGENMSYALMQGAVEVTRSRRIAFDGCVFQHLGAAALTIANASKDVRVSGCLFQDNAGGGVLIGDFEDPQALIEEQSSGHVVFNNTLLGPPLMYRSNGGIVAGFVRDTVVEHNTVVDMTSGGIELGWGWGKGVYNTSFAQNNSVRFNFVNHSNAKLSDLGPLYVNGYQRNSVMSGNWVLGVVGSPSIYPDEGSRDWLITDNVVENCSMWLSIWTSSIANITVTGNFYGPTDTNRSQGTNCTVTNNTFVPLHAPWPAKANAIRAAAGAGRS